MISISIKDIEIIVSRAIGANVKIINHRIDLFSKDKKGILGSHYLLSVDIQDLSKEDSNPKTHTFFVKTRPDSSITRNSLVDENIFFEESSFFSEILPKMAENNDGEQWSPQCYLANEKVIVLENIDKKGFIISTDYCLDEQLLRSALTTLARFHACSILAEARMGKRFDEAYPNLFVEKFYSNSNNWGKATQVGFDAAASLAKKFGLNSSLVPKIHEKIYQLVRDKDNGCNVVCHNDLWNNNLMFDNSIPPKCILVDYQLLRYASPTIDVAMLLYLNTTPEIRRKLEFSMLEHYYSILRDFLLEKNSKIKIPSYDNILNEYKKYRIIGMAYGVKYLPGVYMKPEDLIETVNDPQNLIDWMLGDRYSIIEKSMKKDHSYEKMLLDILCEFLDEGKQLCQE